MGYMSSGFSTERLDKSYGKKFYGKYRAKVTNNMDSDPSTGRMGRIKVNCPKVLGEDESNWCTPCMPFAGPDKGMYSIPKVGDTVWIEFEEGDPNKPIWVGNWWGVGELPTELNKAYDAKEVGFHHVFDTPQFKLHINDKTQTATITIKNGLTIKNPVTIEGNVSVSGNISASGTVKGSNI